MAQFLIRKIDPNTGCFVEEYLLSQKNSSEPTKLLNLPSLNQGEIIELDSVELLTLVRAFNISFSSDGKPGELIRLGDNAKHNPNSHTGRELLLMITGKKPFAAFSELQHQSSEDSIIPEKYFEPFVKQSMILKFDSIHSQSKHSPVPLRRVLYALPGQQWRANAYIALWKLAATHGWNSGFELMEGFLLGYETTIDSYFLDSLPDSEVDH
jgi:hypothetical protein